MASERTQQRRLKRHLDEIAALQSRRRSGPPLSLASAANKVRAEYTWETGDHAKTCKVCGEPFTSRRSDAKTCSPKCRKRLSTGATDPRRWLGDDRRMVPPTKRR